MRSIVGVAVVALLMVGTTLGAGTVTVIGPASFTWGETIEIQVVLTADEPMTAFQLDGIMATNGATPGPVVGTTTEERAAYHYGNTAGWSTDPGDTLMGWASQTSFPVGPIGAIASGDEAGNGVCFRMNVVAPIEADWCEVYVTGGIYGNEMFEDVVLDSVPLFILEIPEPAGVLLLLGGLAMSRRKRRA